MVITWIADVTPLLDEKRYKTYRERVPACRKEKADRLQNRKDQALSIGVWTLWMGIKNQYGLSDEGLFNLSHSGRYALCSAYIPSTGERRNDEKKTDQDHRYGKSTHLLGCDVEMIADYRPKIAKRFFCPSEYEHLEALPSESEQVEDFYRFWVLKESFVKATREGIGRAFDSFEIELWGHPVGARLKKWPEALATKFYYQEYEVPEKDAKVAVCSTDPVFDELVIRGFE